MTHIVVLGAGIGGMSAAYELRGTLGPDPRITVIGEGDLFSFTPSNPWVAVGWRKPDEVQIPVRDYLEKKKIAFEDVGTEKVEPDANRIVLRDGRTLDYDYLVIATGPRPPRGRPTRHSSRTPARSWSAPRPARVASARPTNSR